LLAGSTFDLISVFSLQPLWVNIAIAKVMITNDKVWK